MSRLDYCQYELVDDCYDWKNDHCDGCNIFKAYCEGARRAKNLIVRCKDCRWFKQDSSPVGYGYCDGRMVGREVDYNDYCSYGERQCNYFGERKEP